VGVRVRPLVARIAPFPAATPLRGAIYAPPYVTFLTSGGIIRRDTSNADLDAGITRWPESDVGHATTTTTDLYFFVRDGSSLLALVRRSRTTGERELIAAGQGRDPSVAVDEKAVYWTRDAQGQDSAQIRRRAHGGTSIDVSAPDLEGPSGLMTDERFVYRTTATPDAARLERIPVEGGAREVLATWIGEARLTRSLFDAHGDIGWRRSASPSRFSRYAFGTEAAP
jgi:hypothetical protein